LRRHIAKLAAAFIAQEPVRPHVGEVEIRPAVVVVIGDRDADPGYVSTSSPLPAVMSVKVPFRLFR
jgi:hypothetical protein